MLAFHEAEQCYNNGKQIQTSEEVSTLFAIPDPQSRNFLGGSFNGISGKMPGKGNQILSTCFEESNSKVTKIDTKQINFYYLFLFNVIRIIKYKI